MLVTIFRGAAAFALIVAIGAPSSAQDFFKGKQVTLLVAGTAGGGIDIGARVMARHLGKYIPGQSERRRAIDAGRRRHPHDRPHEPGRADATAP